MDIYFNAYKTTISPKSNIIVYKNGGIGLNPHNTKAMTNLLNEKMCKVYMET